MKTRFACLILFTIILVSAPVNAINNKNVVTVSPAYIQASVSSSRPSQDEAISVRNDFDVPVHLVAELQAVDTSTGKLLPAGKSNSVINATIHLEQTDFIVGPHTSINLKLSISDNPSLPPGGYPVALLIKQVMSGSVGVGVQSGIVANIYVIKEDGAIRQVELQKPQFPKIVFTMPTNVTLAFKNKGNVSVTPHGQITINKDGTDYGKAIINDGSLPISVEQDLSLKTDIRKLQPIIWPGKYDVRVSYRIEGQDKEVSFDQTIFYFPPWLLLVVGLLLVAAWKRKRLTSVFAKPASKKTIQKHPKKTRSNDATK